MLSRFDTINHVQIYWKAYQDTFLKEFLSSDNGMLADLVEYQARIIYHLSSAQLSRVWQKVAGWNDWKKVSHVDMLSDHRKSRTDIAQVEETRLKWNQQLEQMYKSRAALQQVYEVLEEQSKQQLNDRKYQDERGLLAHLAADH
ncbi:hypothetical protein F5B21DRAFT_336400 [Xylaria acuta]|nr:hypothetical protein F5B21DRAFT_336400 [Xylaria acuta]